MFRSLRVCSVFAFSAAVFLAASSLPAKSNTDAFQKQIDGLKDLKPAQQSAAILKMAADIRALPADKSKVTLADNLYKPVTNGDLGAEARQAVADTLAAALKESPIPAKKDWPAGPYFDLAKLVRYEHATTTLDDPMYAKAAGALANNEADIAKADFTLKDLHGKKFTLSQFKGKVILINFFQAAWCDTCMQELADLDAIYTHLESQGLMVISIDSEEIPISDLMRVANVVEPMHYHPLVLLDPGWKVAGQFHIDGAVPSSIVLDRDGKVAAVGVNHRTQIQFLTMLLQAGIHQ